MQKLKYTSKALYDVLKMLELISHDDKTRSKDRNNCNDVLKF